MSKFASYYNSTFHFFTIHLILIFGCSDKTWQSKSDVVNSIFLNLEYNNYDSIQIMQYFDSIQKQINIKIFEYLEIILIICFVNLTLFFFIWFFYYILYKSLNKI